MFTIWFDCGCGFDSDSDSGSGCGSGCGCVSLFACHTMAAKLKTFAQPCLRFIFHVGHSIVFDTMRHETTHATRWQWQWQWLWQRPGPESESSRLGVLRQITNKYHAWPKAAIKAINWQQLGPDANGTISKAWHTLLRILSSVVLAKKKKNIHDIWLR